MLRDKHCILKMWRGEEWKKESVNKKLTVLIGRKEKQGEWWIQSRGYLKCTSSSNMDQMSFAFSTSCVWELLNRNCHFRSWTEKSEGPKSGPQHVCAPSLSSGWVWALCARLHVIYYTHVFLCCPVLLGMWSSRLQGSRKLLCLWNHNCYPHIPFRSHVVSLST